MSVGFGITQADINVRSGTVVDDVKKSLARAAAFCDLLNDTSIFANDAALTALGYTQAEVTLLRAAMTDLKALYNVAHAVQSTGVNDFFANAKKLTGVVI